MFKVGDKVRCVNPSSCLFLNERDTYIVSDLGKIGQIPCIRVQGHSPLVFASRFKLVKEKKVASNSYINKMTDQELADEYRHYISKARPFRQELIDRGFSFLNEEGKRPLFFHDVETIRITKPTVVNL